MKFVMIAGLIWIAAGCQKPAPVPRPEPTIAQKKLDLAEEILISMYSHRDGLRKQSTHDAVAEAREAAAEFYSQSTTPEIKAR